MGLCLRTICSYILIFLLTVSASMTGLASEPTENYEFLDQFELYLEDNILPYIPGAAVLVVVDGEVRFIKAHGVRKAGFSDRITQDTVFRLASVSKGFASTATGLLVRNNQLSWDTSVQSRLEDVIFKDSNFGKRITLRNLLSHSTGLIPHAYTNLVEDNVSYNRIKERLKEVDFICAPGECYSYQNVAFSLAGDVIESVTGKEYEDYVRENLFIPLEMKTASFGLESFNSSENHAIPHVRRMNTWKPVKVNRNYYNIAPAAGVNASIRDMEKWIMAQLGHRPDVLPEQTLDDLHSRIISTSARQAHFRRMEDLGEVFYGLGWRIFDYGEHKDFIYHGGWVQGMLSEMVFNRELQMGMVFLTNSETRIAGNLVIKFIELFQQRYQKSVDTDDESIAGAGS